MQVGECTLSSLFFMTANRRPSSDMPAWKASTYLRAGDIAYIYSRFCPDMERECVRAMGRTDATPFMESLDAHWASIANWTEDEADLGDVEEFDEGDEPLSDGDDTDDDDS